MLILYLADTKNNAIINSAKTILCAVCSEKNKGNKMNSGAGEEEAEVEKEKEGTELGG